VRPTWTSETEYGSDVQVGLTAQDSPFHRRVDQTDEGAVRIDACYYRIEVLAYAGRHRDRGSRLAHLTLDLARAILAFGAVRGDRDELVPRVGRRLSRQRGLEKSLRNQIREAAVGLG